MANGSQKALKINVGYQFAAFNWGGLFDARADMYIVVIAEMAAK